MVVGTHLGIEAHAAVGHPHLGHLPDGHQLVQRVVGGGLTDGRLVAPGGGQNLFHGEMDVLSAQRLHHRPPLGGEPPVAGAEALDERIGRYG